MTERTENHISGGAFFGCVVQGRSISLTLPDRPDPALAGLPGQSATFAGRRPQLEQILAALAPAPPNTTSGTVVVSGLAGTGKTEIVLQAAHRALGRDGWFPGGVLFLDLHGYDPKHKVSPKRALGTLLRALGIPPEHIPSRIEERSTVYRSALAALAAAGRRVLVVLDDVPATGKVHHLLPSDGSTATLVSSRHSLAELDALALTLRELPADEGRELLGDAVRTALPEDSRVVAETDEADRLVALCGGLPLALRILASLLVDVPTRPLAHLRQDLEDTHSRLSVLSREERAVTATFALSYRGLAKDQAELFRLVSLHPGPDFSTEATTVLYGKSCKETERLLLDLARRHLIEPRGPYGRWQQHDLVRLYSWEQLVSGDDSWGKALMRLLLHFHKTATSACERLFQPAPSQPEGSSGSGRRAEALQWLEAERHTLVAAALWAHEVGDDLMCVALSVPVSKFLMEMRYLEDAGWTLSAGIRSSRRRKDSFTEASLLSSLGVVLRDMRKLRKSVRAHHKAIKICRALKKCRALASALNNLGLSLHEQRKFEEAVAAHNEAAQLFKRAGDRLGVAGALSNTGETLTELGRAEEAADALEKAAKIFRKKGDLRGYAQALGSLAKATRNNGKAEQAVKLHRRALEMPDGLLLPHERAVELSNFAGTLTAAGEFEAALTAQQEALETFRQLGDHRGEAMTLGNMAQVCHAQGRWKKAVQLHTLAMEAFLEGKDDHGLASELTALAVALLQQGCNTEALENLELAADLYHQTGDAEKAVSTLDSADQLRRQVGVGMGHVAS
ncbi:transcriptional regulator [Streptomyces chrestomyceticus JCM 4735]|uniref:Transcriptional regulator n=1 Tax=Streptomyces chrestomyceticus JCM 4735 TaxID=1306181 RepID=A0A7U9KUD5_9ACTN|nr:tetratricopeptide repeat protein [Streptomyces chrestomyceticus]GCD35547.1 transcriptional regulator [Streptomyces chrestomyceticus JCM 4735]